MTEEKQETSKAGIAIEKKKKPKKNKEPKLIFSLLYTVYPLVKSVAKELGFRVRTDDTQLMPPPPGSEEYYLR